MKISCEEALGLAFTGFEILHDHYGMYVAAKLLNEIYTSIIPKQTTPEEKKEMAQKE
jgi:hypothetical protein